LETTLSKKEKRICKQAARILTEKEHKQFSYGDGVTSVCMAGALALASGLKLENYPVEKASLYPQIPVMETILTKAIPDICNFNNRHTKEECVERLLAMSA
jgi:hypothetical protein